MFESKELADVKPSRVLEGKNNVLKLAMELGHLLRSRQGVATLKIEQRVDPGLEQLAELA